MKIPLLQQRRTPSDPTPQEKFDRAAKNQEYSNKACIRSCKLKTVILTGAEAGEEKAWAWREEKMRARHWKSLFSSRVQGVEPDHAYVDKNGDKPAYARVGVTQVERGHWNGRKAHFLVLRIEHHRGAAHCLQRVEVDIRVWKAGDALKSITKRSHVPLSSLSPPAALEFSAAAPEISLYGPRAVVGRPRGTSVDCFWDGHFQPGDRWRYFAELSTPQRAAVVRPTRDEVWSVLRIASYGDYDFTEPAHDFSVGLVIVSDGEPFDLTAHSETYHVGRHSVRQYLWTPYEPVRVNETVRLRPKGHQPIGTDFSSQEMKMRWKNVIDWSEPYDTIWFGDKRGCVDNERSAARCCPAEYCSSCPPHTPASTCEVCNPALAVDGTTAKGQ